MGSGELRVESGDGDGDGHGHGHGHRTVKWVGKMEGYGMRKGNWRGKEDVLATVYG